MNYIDENKLEKLASDLSYKYQNSVPYNHIYIDNFFNNNDLEKLLESFPDDIEFYKYDNPLEKKLAYDQVKKLPVDISSLLYELNSSDFLNFLEKISGIEGLIPDPYFRGGGIHEIKRGGKLDIHVDFNIHPKLKLVRRLNVIIYLNKDWQESWNGDFQVWSGEMIDGKHTLKECFSKIYPFFNRLVIFSTSENSYHGHPEELLCPDDFSRKSLALYYYTSPDNLISGHSTTFVKLPNENSDLDEIRKKRNLGRLSTNIKTNLL
jgi:Rps23 Pro-64 3,4-dihydroxylase Tpa1-like proline 4-hydroxylase